MAEQKNDYYKPDAKETRTQIIKFVLFSASAGIVETVSFTLLKLITPWGYWPWVEQDPEDYWKAVCKTSKKILEENGIAKDEIKGIVFSTQAQGVIPVDQSGNVLYNNITWVDGRAQLQAEHIMKKVGGKKLFTMLAGTPIMGKDCIAEITWLKEERPDIYEKTHLILDVNGYLKYKCTGRMVTELSGASSYGLDLKKETCTGQIG